MSASGNPQGNSEQRSRKYSTIKYGLSIIEIVYSLLLLAVLLSSGVSRLLAKDVALLVSNNFLGLVLYLFIIYVAYYILSFPLNFYHNFILEHQFQLSRQSVRGWFLDQAKSGIISFVISIILLEVFFLLVAREPQTWWWIISIFWISLSLVLAKLAPVLIIPLFFKYRKMADESLRRRIIAISQKMNLKILDVFEIDLSRKTEKGNAALVGFGSTRRVILGDTLKGKYTPEEIEVILAHEFAHQKLQHLIKMVLVNAASTVICFYAIYKTSFYALKLFNLASLDDIAALPVIFIYLMLAGIILKPWENFLSRKFETEADSLAITRTGLKEAFVSTMEKLAAQNLADRNPHPLVKFFFFDHPAIDERIKLARSL
jgi:STE24 endopeptidase